MEEACVSLYEILFDCTWTTVDSKDGAVGVGGYGGTWVTGEWSGAGRINGVSGRSGGVNGEGGGIFMNVARLLTQTKRKNEVLSDLCDGSTLFLCLWIQWGNRDKWG